jgi:hypothetical protein
MGSGNYEAAHRTESSPPTPDGTLPDEYPDALPPGRDASKLPTTHGPRENRSGLRHPEQVERRFLQGAEVNAHRVGAAHANPAQGGA